MLETTCPHCGRQLELDEDRRGRPVRCPHCGEGFRAPLGDHEPGIAGRGKGSAADVTAVIAAAVAVLGLLATAGALLLVASGRTLPLGRTAIMAAALVPMAAVLVTWLVARKASSAALVLVGRVAAYLWLMGLVVLMMKLR